MEEREKALTFWAGLVEGKQSKCLVEMNDKTTIVGQLAAVDSMQTKVGIANVVSDHEGVCKHVQIDTDDIHCIKIENVSKEDMVGILARIIFTFFPHTSVK
mmetsp:Transcript_23933/g.38175  ORF Transcript_23933/g.38175 Transcript_23933/m.38175 type:complete len:101 (+) Transcript_23933:246-548(+)